MQKEIEFDVDGYKIHGVFHSPMVKKAPVVIGSHGLFSSGDSPKQIALAEACNANGIAYFRFDHRGCGKSSGAFSSATTFDGRCRDLIKAVEIMRGFSEGENSIGLFGSSYGGAVALAAANLFQPKAMVVVAAPVSLSGISQAYIADPNIQSRLMALTEDRLSFDVHGLLPEISNILIFHGDQDEVVPFANAHTIYENSKQPKKLVRQKDGDHPMSNPAHQLDFIHSSAQWFKNAFNDEIPSR